MHDDVISGDREGIRRKKKSKTGASSGSSSQCSRHFVEPSKHIGNTCCCMGIQCQMFLAKYYFLTIYISGTQDIQGRIAAK